VPRRKKPIIQEIVQDDSSDFVVLNTSAKSSVTQESAQKSIDTIAQEAIESAVRAYDFNNKLSSTILETKGSVQSPTIDLLDRLAERPQNDLN
jgi:DNA-binding sugar fermentation-stimulating protein